MKIKYLLAVISLAFLSGCSYPEPAAIEFKFKLQYDGEPLVLFEDVTYPDGTTIAFDRFSFYMSELQIGNQAIEGVTYMDLTSDHVSLEKSKIGTSFFVNNLEDQEVTSISFVLGLSEDINATLPSSYTSNNDLSLAGEYWTPWNSYIFSKTEGKMDLDNDGVNEFSVALHLGSNEAKRTVTLNTDMILTEDVFFEKDIIIDLKKVFEGSNGIYDIRTTPQIHQLNSMDEINELADNMVSAFSIN